MSTDWKYGDLALVTCSDGEERRAIFLPGGSGYYGTWLFPDNTRRRACESEARPLLVVDPEDSEQVTRLWGAYERDENYTAGPDGMQAALRSLITPPRPTEPTGDGAVVLDARGRRWTRIAGADTDPGSGAAFERTQASPPWRIRGANARWYDEIDVERVLFEGVPA